MSGVFVAPILSAGLEKFKEIVLSHSERDGREGKRLVVFCEDRLSLAVERAVCDAVGGTFAVSVFTLSRFLQAQSGKAENVLTSQGSAMAIRKLIEANKDKLQLFKRLSTASAAQEVYDTIALLYSSKISPDDLNGAETENRLLKRKLHDLELLYREYINYLEERGAEDRNAYLRKLPAVIKASPAIKGADLVFFGFQAFTSSVADCVRAGMQTADSTYGIFVGGEEKKYVNEAWTTFEHIAKEEGLIKDGKKFITHLPSNLTPAAETLRKFVLEPESLIKRNNSTIVGGQLQICEASDDEESCQFIASQILKCVREDSLRYREISVMFPSVAGVQPSLERAFGEYGIPMYVDRRYPLASHSVCSFILDYFSCAADGCRLESVLGAVGSPLFKIDGGNRADRDAFVNYYLRSATYRGGVKKAPNPQVCADEGLKAETVERVRQPFLQGLKLIPTTRSDGSAFCGAAMNLLKLFGAEETLAKLSEEAEEQGYHSVAEMSARAYRAVTEVIAEAERLTSGEKITVKEFIKILKSGFTATEISLIPPKQDAVFVGDLSACANTGSKVLFVGGLTDAVPSASQDTAILTDSEITSLENIKLAVSPKIWQVNRRVREITALNLCAFSQKLYLLYPLRSGGDECGVSEIISYIEHLFTLGDRQLKAVPVKELAETEENFVYSCARPAPAKRRVTLYLSGDRDYGERRISAVHRFWREREGVAEVSEFEWTPTDWRSLYGDSVSPTALEAYYSCPYRAFMEKGLRLTERREGNFRPLDSGNFIHTVLEEVAKQMNGVDDEEGCAALARAAAENLLTKSVYSVDDGDGGSQYTASALVEEAVAVSVGAFRQLKGSRFAVSEVEAKCKLDLDGGMSVGGRIDRVDTDGDLVRVIDYKTGTIDDKPSSYYMGLKLQLPLYLSAVSEGKRPAGAYYFPANLEYSADGVGEFTLRGFMDGSEEVVRASDTAVEEKGKSRLVGAYLNGKKLDRAMSREDFIDFISYAKIMAKRGADGLTCGKIAPSPVKGTCEYCKLRGCCGYDAERQGEREEVSADCKKVAEIVREAMRTGGDGVDDGIKEEGVLLSKDGGVADGDTAAKPISDGGKGDNL